MTSCEICDLLPEIHPEYVLYEGKYWSANLRDNDQTLLGTSIITAKRHVPELDGLAPEEETEYTVIRNVILRATREAFRPITFNVSCLKNNVFMKDPDNTSSEAAHVHWHIKPRYGTRAIAFSGDTFQDPMPGKYLSSFERHAPSAEVCIAIAAAIRSHIT